MSRPTAYIAEPVLDGDRLTDVRVRIDGKVWHMWGRKALEREKSLADAVSDDALPVLLGAGLGECLSILRERGRPVAVVDRETEIDAVAKVRERFSSDSGVSWFDKDDAKATYDALLAWRSRHGDAPFFPIAMPLYLRLDRDYYGALVDSVKQTEQPDFWSRARYPKFRSAPPRTLFFDSDYFLCREIKTALERLGVPNRSLELGAADTGTNEFIETLLKTVLDFKPDFVLTVNHFGLDREGKLAELLEDLGLPLASWFVDNPHLILHEYAHPGADNTALFTFDAGNLDMLRAKGFLNVHYLPLATDPDRFAPNPNASSPSTWRADVSFVGSSMSQPVAKCLAEAQLPESLRSAYMETAADFGQSDFTQVVPFLEAHRPEWIGELERMPTPELRLALESLLTWEATRQYRLDCISRTLDHAPLIVGDAGWEDQLSSSRKWRRLDRIDYYHELPSFYPCSKINFNCTSRQMIGAVNQRVFDAPASGGFVLTDYRKQMENLFDLDAEAAVYRSPDEIPELLGRFLSEEKDRKKIAEAARRRILAEHTYRHRLVRMLDVMRKTFS